MTERGIVDPGMASVLNGWHDFVSTRYIMHPDVIGNSILPSCAKHTQAFARCYFTVYLATSPAVAFERIQQRARIEESSITLEYLEHLDRLHSDWIIQEDSNARNDECHESSNGVTRYIFRHIHSHRNFTGFRIGRRSTIRSITAQV